MSDVKLNLSQCPICNSDLVFANTPKGVIPKWACSNPICGIQSDEIPTACVRCGGEIKIEEAVKCFQWSQPVFCSQYCFEVYNGVPIPGTSGEAIFDKWHNDRQVR